MNTKVKLYILRKRQQRRDRKQQKLCVICGLREAIPGMSGCDYCYDHNQTYKEELQKGRRELGFCVQCGDPADINPRTHQKFARCKKCRDYQANARRIERAKKMQDTESINIEMVS